MRPDERPLDKEVWGVGGQRETERGRERGREGEGEIWSGLNIRLRCSSPSFTGEPALADGHVPLLVSESCCVLSNGVCVAVLLGFRVILLSEAHMMNCSQSGPLLEIIGKCFQSV